MSTFAVRERLRPFTVGLTDGFSSGSADGETRRTGEDGSSANFTAYDRDAQYPFTRHVGNVRTEDGLAEGHWGVPHRTRQA